MGGFGPKILNPKTRRMTASRVWGFGALGPGLIVIHHTMSSGRFRASALLRPMDQGSMRFGVLGFKVFGFNEVWGFRF